MSEQNIDGWRIERNAALMALNMDYARKVMPNASSDEVRLIAMHKARYDCTDLPDRCRHESAEWLRERGYGATRGPLLPAGELPK